MIISRISPHKLPHTGLDVNKWKRRKNKFVLLWLILDVYKNLQLLNTENSSLITTSNY